MSPDAREVLVYENVVLAPGRAPLSGALLAGEIVGFAGLEGHGQEEFLLTLAGLRKTGGGRIAVQNADRGLAAYADHHAAARHGVVYLPRDRRATGIFPVLPVLDNFGLPSMRRFSIAGILDRKRQREALARYTEFLSIRHPGPGAPISALSGGNQQKVLLARLLALEPRVMLLNDPTRGVDLATRLKFYAAFRDLAREKNIALVVLSTEIEEILQVCDRVRIFHDFSETAVIEKKDMTMNGVIAAMFAQGSPTP
ncbi:ATP-binding cassette domain-containing protein [Aureimonas psammosilenae]|uniref:ATP-binding cassette domain-containing protein n=1 Tax=Aureimonas psammosilenae TaxID=2495496 RepID=UPI001260993C|nr:ATP-binding cassette domain-containing protein [Aureimonas psammosilenae]